MKTNVLSLIITLVLGIILAGSILAPAVTDAATTTYTNNSSDGVEYVAADSFTMTKEAAGTAVNINGVEIDNAGTDLMLFSDNFVWNKVGATSLLISSAGVNNISAKSFNGTYANGTLTYSIDGGESVSVTLTNVLVATDKGDYVSINDNTDAIVKERSDVRTWGYGAAHLMVYNGTELTATPTGSETINIDYTITEDKINLSGISMTYGSTAVAANTIIVPKTVSFDNEYATLYMILPIVVIIALVALGARAVMGARD